MEPAVANAKHRAIEERLKFETLLTDISAHFINLPPERLDSEIEKAMQMVLEFFQVDRCALLRILPDQEAWEITHIVYSLNTPPLPSGIVLSASINPWAYNKLVNKGEVVLFSTIDEISHEAQVDKQTWENWGIRSNMVIPVFNNESVVYVIAINAVKKERVWPAVFIPRLQLLGEIFINALERRKTEMALFDSEERLRLAVNSAEAGLWTIHVDTGLIWATEKLREIFRFSPEEDISFERVLETVHPNDRQRVKEAVEWCLQTREMFRIEYRIPMPDGKVRWVMSHGRSYPVTSEQPERVMGATIDITNRKVMEERLLEKMAENQRLKDQLEKENLYLRDEIDLAQGYESIIAKSRSMKKILAQVEQVAGTDATVLLSGETGTGKELLARAIHNRSSRKQQTLITINCAALPSALIESELFGRERGAYTGALTRMTGRFELADRSTLLLDEISELPIDLQAKLLRVIEIGSFERLGSTKTQQVDVRIIAATNRDLNKEVAASRFRSDLFYRLSVFPISIPPLRERVEDIPPLVWMFVKQNEKRLGKRIARIPRKDMEALKRYDWPGNARELRNIIERAMIMSHGEQLNVKPPNGGTEAVSSHSTLAEIEHRHILSVLKKTGWRVAGQSGAAEILGLKRSTLQAKMKKLGISRPSQ